MTLLTSADNSGRLAEKPSWGQIQNQALNRKCELDYRSNKFWYECVLQHRQTCQGGPEQRRPSPSAFEIRV